MAKVPPAHGEINSKPPRSQYNLYRKRGCLHFFAAQCALLSSPVPPPQKRRKKSGNVHIGTDNVRLLGC